MTQQVPSQPQEVPPAQSVGAPAGQPAPQAAAIPGAPMAPQGPTTPPQAQTAPGDVEKLQRDYQAMQEQIKRLQGTQAAKDRQLYELQMRYQQERAAMQAELQRQQMAQLPEEQQKELTFQQLQQQLEQERQARVDLEWSRYLQSVAMDLTSRYGVPYDVLVQASSQAPRPDVAYQYMNQAALDYVYHASPAQRAPPSNAPQQYAQPQTPPVAPPHPTAYAQGGVPSTTDEDFRALQERTRATGKSSVEEGLALMRKRWEQDREQ